MKKFLFFVPLMASLVMFMSSCGNDNDADSGSAATNAGVLDEASGLRITSVDGWIYTYGSDGRVKTIKKGGDKLGDTYEFSYNPNTIRFVLYEDYSGNIYTDTTLDAVTYDGQGRISSLSATFSDIDDHSSLIEEFTESDRISFSYNGAGHLEQEKFEENVVSKTIYPDSPEKNEESKENSVTTVSYTWEGDRLVRVVDKEKTTGEGKDADGTKTGEFTTETTWTLTYSNDNANKYMQNSYSTAFDEDYFDGALWYIGLFGKGSNALPTSVESSYKCLTRTGEYDFDHGPNPSSTATVTTWTYSYVFNSDGSLQKETCAGGWYDSDRNIDYSYSNASNKSAIRAYRQPRQIQDGASVHGVLSRMSAWHRARRLRK